MIDLDEIYKEVAEEIGVNPGFVKSVFGFHVRRIVDHMNKLRLIKDIRKKMLDNTVKGLECMTLEEFNNQGNDMLLGSLGTLRCDYRTYLRTYREMLKAKKIDLRKRRALRHMVQDKNKKKKKELKKLEEQNNGKK